MSLAYPELLGRMAERLNELETRLRALERSEPAYPTGTMVVNLNADLLDGIHANTDVTASQLLALNASKCFPNGFGIGSNTVLATIRKTGIADNSATGIFSVTTTNETGDNDGGAYTCRVWSTITHLATPTSTNAAVKFHDAYFYVVNKADGTKVSATAEILETGSAAATSSLTRDIASVTPGENDASNYQTDYRLTIDLNGSDVQTAEATCFIVLIWSGYTTAPVIAAL